MAKTNLVNKAYGLRGQGGWNPFRIIRRNFCVKRLNSIGIINIVEDDDAVFLEEYDVSGVANKGSDAMTERNEVLKIISSQVVAPYYKHMLNHYEKIETIKRKILGLYAELGGSNNETNEKLVRIQTLSTIYANATGNIGDLQTKIAALIRSNDKEIDAQYRREIGGRVRQARQAKGATQLEAAMASRISRGMLAAFERGEKEISFPTFKRLTEFLDVTASELL